ncbi:hypothetical protein ACFPM7_20170 [Actinokineospora guangxiensis]|uniref:DUF1330 domain-containing protein n=1 Tax=Actinokineospora guangxiensis TaxID=1490288 RepID=A0ABW0EPM4_9PSEU
MQRKISDITGEEAAEADFVTLIVRQHPKVDQPKRLDALPSELDQLKPVGDLVVVEVRRPDTSVDEVYVRYADFAKLIPDSVVDGAPGTKGRIPGTRINGKH